MLIRRQGIIIQDARFVSGDGGRELNGVGETEEMVTWH